MVAETNELSGLDQDMNNMNDQLLDAGEISDKADNLEMVSPRVVVDPAHRAQTESEEQKAEPVESVQSLDADLLKQIWIYVRPASKIPGAGALANESEEIAQELKQEITNSLELINETISELKALNPGLEPNAAS